MQVSKSIFLLIIAAIIAGWIYMKLNPSHNIEQNLELNINYFPHITEERIRNR